MNSKLISVMLTSIVALPLLAQAADNTVTPRLDRREARQEARINQGVASGELTAHEANNLQKRENNLAANEAVAKADGKVTRAERAGLEAQANHISNRTYIKKHNARSNN